MRAIVANGAFPCGAAVRTCLDHGGRGNGVDADAQHLVLRALFFELLDQRTAAALAVNDDDAHEKPPFAV